MLNEDLEKNISILNARNSELADMQVILSKDIERLRPILAGLEGRISVLNTEIVVVEKRIAEKEAQRNESLNKREEEISELDNKYRNMRAEYDSLLNSLVDREIQLQQEQGRIKKDADKNYEDLITNKSEAKRLELLNSSIQEAMDILLKDQERIASLKSFLETQQSMLDEKETLIENKEEEVSKREEALAGIESLFAQRDEEYKKKDNSLIAASLAICHQKDDLKLREDAIKEKESYAAGELKLIEEEKKKITLAWLQVNKKIQDNKIDIELKELQK